MKNNKKQTEAHFHINGLNVEVYDQRLQETADPLLEGDTEFYIEYAKKYCVSQRKPVLELGSGTGRISWELARAGVEVLGVDYSETMIQIAENKRDILPKEIQERVTFIKGDITKLDLAEKFSLIIIPCRTFQCLLTAKEQMECLQSAYKHLADDGLFILDLFDPNFAPRSEEEWQEDIAKIPTVIHPRTGNKVEMEFLERTVEFFEQQITEFWQYREIAENGEILRSEDSDLPVRWVTRPEMRYLLMLNGFEIVNEYSSFHKDKPVYGKEQIWLVKKSTK